jgi:hypothetical protein
MQKSTLLLTLMSILAGTNGAAAAEAAKAAHPYLLWNRSELQALRDKIETQPWAGQAYEDMVSSSERDGEDMRLLFRYAVMGDRQAGEIEKTRLLSLVKAPDPLGAAIEWRILAYDILYDELSSDERASIEQRLRRYIRYAIKPGGTYDTSIYNNERNYARYDGEQGRYTRTNWLPNIIFPWKLSANLAAAALGDEQLIREAWAVDGSIRWYFDEYLGDLGFYEEEFSKMGSTPGALLLYCTAVRNLGLDELGFAYQGKGGASMRGHIESVLHFTFPGVDTGTQRWRFERMSAGDVRPWMPFAHATVEGHFPNGESRDKLWQAHGAWGGTVRGKNAQWDGYSNFTPKMQTRMWFEWGHHLWPDAGFDWFLAQMRAPEETVYTPTLYFGPDPIDPQQVSPPAIESRVYPDRGFAMLRAEEGPDHWTSPAPAVCLRLTAPYAHSVNDPLVLAGFYAFNRPIYQNPKSDPGYAFKFSRSIRSHCGVMVDGHIKKDDWGQTGSLEPEFTDDCTTRQDFSEEVKFVAARTQERYPGVDETRALMLTREYLFDVFTAHDNRQHSYVWLVHTFGEATLDDPNQWRPSNNLAELVKELTDVRAKDTGGLDWSVTVRQVPPLDPPENTPLGNRWWSRNIGVRIHMLGLEDAKAHVGATPKPSPGRKRTKEIAAVDGMTVVSSVMSPSATFAALHEPFEDRPQIKSFERIAQTDDALVARATSDRFDDRLMVRVGDRASQPLTLAGDGERFTFAGHAFIRRSGQAVVVRGNLHAMALHVRDTQPKLVVNGAAAEARVADGYLQWRKK